MLYQSNELIWMSVEHRTDTHVDRHVEVVGFESVGHLTEAL